MLSDKKGLSVRDIESLGIRVRDAEQEAKQAQEDENYKVQFRVQGLWFTFRTLKNMVEARGVKNAILSEHPTFKTRIVVE
jgi:hypothetical protein